MTSEPEPTASVVRIGDDLIAFYAVIAAGGVTLIDAGLSGDRGRLVAALAAHSCSLADIRGIVLTHGDSDHIGIAEALRRELAVPVFVHSADAARARGEEKSSGRPGSMRLLGLVTFLWTSIRRGGLRNRHIGEVAVMADGDVLDLPGSPEIISVPGHSPGSVVVRVPSADALFVGDAVTTKHVLTGIARVQPAPFTDVPEQADASLRSLAHLPERRIFPGHGPEFHGTMRELIAALDAE